MKRFIVNFVALLIGLFLGGYTTYASAETIAATAVPNTKQSQCINAYGGGQSWSWATTTAPSNNAECVAHGYNGYYSDHAGCYTALTNSGCTYSSRMITDYTCPANQNWTLSGTSCTRPDCQSGETRQADGTCKKQCASAGASVAGVTGTTQGGTGSMPSSICIDGCSFDWGGVAVQLDAGWAASAGKATGEACSTSAVGTNGTPATSEPAASALPTSANSCIQAGQGYGTINGVVVCTGPASTTHNKDATTKTTTHTDGTTGTTTTNKTSTCADGSCTTTETTMTTGGGVSGTAANGTSTTTTTQTLPEFCAQNPNDARCKAKPETQDDICAKHPDRLECKDMGSPEEPSTALGTKSIGVSSITPVSLATNMTCPAPITLPKNYGTFSWTPICDVAGMVRPLLLVFAWIGAGLIVVGGVKNG